MSISHEAARKLIQFKADSVLNPTDQTMLIAHLNECLECRTYSNGLENTVLLLKRTMRKEWNTAHLPLPMELIFANNNVKRKANTILTTRTALIGAVALLFTFVAWQTITRTVTSSQHPFGMIPLIPTPSMQYTATNLSINKCQDIKYRIREGDTLDSIARQFSLPLDSLILANNLLDASLETVQELVIPICETSPTSTIFPPTFTITPVFEPVVTTPG